MQHPAISTGARGKIAAAVMILGAVATANAAADASTVTLPPEVITGAFDVGAGTEDHGEVTQTTITGPGTSEIGYKINAPDIILAQAGGTLTIGNLPSPSITATANFVGIGASSLGPVGETNTAIVSLRATITYGLAIVGPPSIQNLGISAQGGVGIAPWGNCRCDGLDRASAGFTVGGIGGSVSVDVNSGPNPKLTDSFNVNTIIAVPTNTVLLVQLTDDLEVSYDGFGTIATVGPAAFVDPVFTLPDSDPNLYSIKLSEGVGNSSATPLPAALPMFLGGAGLIGFFTRHRKQKRRA